MPESLTPPADATTPADALTPADEPLSSVDSRAYRSVLSHFATGVTIVTACSEFGPVGLSIASFTSVSLDPPLVGFLPARASKSWPLIRAAGRFCVNILTANQRPLAQQFAAPHDDRFDGVAWRPAPFSTAPLLEGVAAFVDCEIESVTVAGDHHFVLGRVHELGVLDGEAAPLVFYRSSYATVHR